MGQNNSIELNDTSDNISFNKFISQTGGIEEDTINELMNNKKFKKKVKNYENIINNKQLNTFSDTEDFTLTSEYFDKNKPKVRNYKLNKTQLTNNISNNNFNNYSDSIDQTDNNLFSTTSNINNF